MPECSPQEHVALGGLHCGSVGRVRLSGETPRAGFVDVDLEPTRIYDIEDARVFLTEAGISVDEIAPQVEGKFLSAFIRATKPAAAML